MLSATVAVELPPKPRGAPRGALDRAVRDLSVRAAAILLFDTRSEPLLRAYLLRAGPLRRPRRGEVRLEETLPEFGDLWLGTARASRTRPSRGWTHSTGGAVARAAEAHVRQRMSLLAGEWLQCIL